MAKVRSGFVFGSRVFEVEYDETDALRDIDPDVWNAMSNQQQTRYLSAIADLAAVLYAMEEKIPIHHDLLSRARQLKEKADKACQLN